MPKLEYFVVCRSIATEVDSDELTLSNVLEDVVTDGFPDYLPKLMAISVWRIEDDEIEGDFQAMLYVTPPGNERADFAMNLVRGRKRHRAIQTVYNVPLDGPGELLCEVTLNGKDGASHVITIHDAPWSKTDEGEDEDESE